AEIRARFNRRREGGHPIEKLVRRLLGVDAKLRQYAEGRRFVHAVVDRVGMTGFNKVWESPLTLPLSHALTDPPAWIARVGLAPALAEGASGSAESPPAAEGAGGEPTA